MAYSLHVRIEPGYVHFRVSGDNSVDAVRGYLREIGQICRGFGLRRALIEEALQGPRLYSEDVRAIIAEMGPVARRWVDRVAYIDVNAGAPVPGMEVAASLAGQLGLNVGVFTDVDAARIWLIDDDRTPEPGSES
jgi:hypothetical protein